MDVVEQRMREKMSKDSKIDRLEGLRAEKFQARQQKKDETEVAKVQEWRY
jgi:hypothetical protein